MIWHSVNITGSLETEETSRIPSLLKSDGVKDGSYPLFSIILCLGVKYHVLGAVVTQAEPSAGRKRVPHVFGSLEFCY